MGLTLLTPPASEPVSVAEMKKYLKLETSDDDITIHDLIKACREEAEEFCKKAILPQTWKLTLDCFPYPNELIYLPKPPLISVDSIKFRDAANVLTTVDPLTYQVDVDPIQSRIVPTYNTYWGQTYYSLNTVEITFTCGLAPVPYSLKQAIKYLAAWRYENRLPVLPGSIAQELPYTVMNLLMMNHSGRI